MDEYQLEVYCSKHPFCDCNCMKCPAFALFQRHQLGMDEYDEEND